MEVFSNFPELRNKCDSHYSIVNKNVTTGWSGGDYSMVSPQNVGGTFIWDTKYDIVDLSAYATHIEMHCFSHCYVTEIRVIANIFS